MAFVFLVFLAVHSCGTADKPENELYCCSLYLPCVIDLLPCSRQGWGKTKKCSGWLQTTASPQMFLLRCKLVLVSLPQEHCHCSWRYSWRHNCWVCVSSIFELPLNSLCCRYFLSAACCFRDALVNQSVKLTWYGKSIGFWLRMRKKNDVIQFVVFFPLDRHKFAFLACAFQCSHDKDH